MPVVCDVFDAGSIKRLDLTRRLPKYLGVYVITSRNGVTGTIRHPAFALGKPFCIPRNWVGNQPGSIPRITLFSDRIEWRYLDGGAWNDIEVALGVL